MAQHDAIAASAKNTMRGFETLLGDAYQSSKLGAEPERPRRPWEARTVDPGNTVQRSAACPVCQQS